MYNMHTLPFLLTFNEDKKNIMKQEAMQGDNTGKTMRKVPLHFSRRESTWGFLLRQLKYLSSVYISFYKSQGQRCWQATDMRSRRIAYDQATNPFNTTYHLCWIMSHSEFPTSLIQDLLLYTPLQDFIQVRFVLIPGQFLSVEEEGSRCNMLSPGAGLEHL